MFTQKSDSPSEPFDKISKSSILSPTGLNALLGHGSQFEGKLVFEGTVRIDGIFKGEIISDDKLLIGDKAQIDAEIKVDSVVISGTVNGNIIAKNRVEIHAPATVKGNITSSVLVIDEGVTFDGSCKMSTQPVKENHLGKKPTTFETKQPFSQMTLPPKKGEMVKEFRK